MLFTAKCKEAETNCICTIGGASFEAGSGPSRAAPRVEVGETLIGAVQLQETGITSSVSKLENNKMNNTSNTEADPYDYYYNIYTLYYASYIWVLAAVGVPGNVACIMTIATMTLTTATLYVVLLAAADLAALVLKAKAGYCSYPEHAQEFVITYWHWIVASIYFFLPFTLLAIFTSLILVRLRRQRKASEAIGETTENTRERSQMRVELPICIMMVCAAIVFLVLTLPTCIYHLIVAWKKINVDTPQQWFAWAMFQQLAISLSEANHAVNFYIYFLSVRMFRSRFKQLMMKLF
ncbi:hypothetical protein C0Q70_09147 [Pomacea canaliculata]|uniref:G-protein coupled receptors family 1 profile domain-containing protein n=1 Tax=Pomacea canaliculata TaxID=400727 RepID=A0A2T7P901_POMCA|nr:hypothetical protein C0Q70_09147 [Pomacea canaliculata]